MSLFAVVISARGWFQYRRARRLLPTSLFAMPGRVRSDYRGIVIRAPQRMNGMYPKKVWAIDVPLPFPFGMASIRRETPLVPSQPGAGGRKGRAQSKSRFQIKTHPEATDIGVHPHSRWHIFFAYALGPLYPLLTRWSFGNALWAALGLGSIAAVVMTVWFRTEILQRAERDAVGVVALLAGLCGIVLVGTTAWARALHLAGRRMQRAPVGKLQHPLIVTGMSLLLPGLGLFMSGRPRRGALALWALGPLVIAVVILAHVQWLWQLNQNLVAGRIPRSALELVFISSAVVGIAALLYWIVQALDGARLVSRLTGRVSHGQPVALALLLAVIAFHVAFDRGRVARTLDQFAIAFRLEGLRVVPLVLELGATKLDPSRPHYAQHAAELYDRLGQRERADQLREDLAARHSIWSAYEKTTRVAAPPPPPFTPAALLSLPASLESTDPVSAGLAPALIAD